MVLGGRYRLSFKTRLVSGAAAFAAVRIGSDDYAGNVNTSTVNLAGDQTHTFEGITQVTGTLDRVVIHWDGRAVGNTQIDDVVLTPLGALSIPGVTSTGVVNDMTDIGDNPGRMLGMRPLKTDDKRFAFTVKVSTAAIANVQLLGGAIFLDSTKVTIDSIDREGTGTETGSMGDGSSATYYTASAAQTATRNRLTLVKWNPASSARTGLYYNVSTAGGAGTTATFTVSGHRR